MEIVNATPHDLNLYKDSTLSGSGVATDFKKSHRLLYTKKSDGVVRLTSGEQSAKKPLVTREPGSLTIPVIEAQRFTGVECEPEDLLDREGILVVSMVVAHYLKGNKLCDRPLYVPCTDFERGVRIEGKIVGTTALEIYE